MWEKGCRAALHLGQASPAALPSDPGMSPGVWQTCPCRVVSGGAGVRPGPGHGDLGAEPLALGEWEAGVPLPAWALRGGGGGRRAPWTGP